MLTIRIYRRTIRAHLIHRRNIMEIKEKKKPSVRVQALGMFMASLIIGFGFTLGEHAALSALVSWFGALG